MCPEIVTDPDTPTVDSALIVTLAKQALINLPRHDLYARHFGLNSIEFRKEFGTVKIAMPRRSGHSTAALQLMYEYPNSLLFVHSGSAKNCIRGLLKEYISDSDTRRRIMENIRVPCHTALIDIRPTAREFIIFDQYRNMKPDAIDLVRGSLHASIIVELA